MTESHDRNRDEQDREPQVGEQGSAPAPLQLPEPQPPLYQAPPQPQAPAPEPQLPQQPRYEAPPQAAYQAPYFQPPQQPASQTPVAPQHPQQAAPQQPSQPQHAGQPQHPGQHPSPGQPYAYAAPASAGAAQSPYAQPYPGVAVPGPGGLFDGALHAGELNRPLYGANPIQALARFFRNYANFSGRASRSEFWWMVLFFWAAVFVLAFVAAFVEEASYSYGYIGGYGPGDAVGTLLGLTVLALFFGTLVPWIAIGWRRLHDANLAGPLYLLNLVPYLGSLVVFVFTLLPPRPEGRRFDQPTR